MGILSDGITGPVTGKTGAVATYMRFGQTLPAEKATPAKTR